MADKLNRVYDQQGLRAVCGNKNLLIKRPAGPLVVGATWTAVDQPIRLSVIIPTFNERKSILDRHPQLTALLDRELGDAYELIIVDDDSPDRTWELAVGTRCVTTRSCEWYDGRGNAAFDRGDPWLADRTR